MYKYLGVGTNVTMLIELYYLTCKIYMLKMQGFKLRISFQIFLHYNIFFSC
jgi:hypothetical protein